MPSYKQILKQIANMEQRLCIDDPCEILDDILEIAKAPFLLEKEWRKGCMARYAEKNKEHLKEYHRNYYLKITKTKRKQKAEQKVATMSKDIWHKAGFHEAIDDKLKVSKDGKWVYWTMYGWNIPGKDAHDIGCEWAYLDDLLALETELERTRKALKIAVDALKEIDKTRSVANHKIGTQDKTLNSGIVFCWATPDEIHNTLTEITALEQKD